MRRLVPIATVASLAIALAAVLPAPPAAAFLFGRKKPAYDWTDLGTEFCARTLAGDLAGIRPLISSQLAADIEFAAATGPLPPARILFQTYENAVPVCRVRTVNAALVEVERSNPNGAPPSWKEYLVIAPERDGTSRVDDVLFATRRSDTLRARLRIWAAGG